MNQICLGQRTTAFASAARTYFNKRLQDLTWPKRPCWPAFRKTRPSKSAVSPVRAKGPRDWY